MPKQQTLAIAMICTLLSCQQGDHKSSEAPSTSPPATNLSQLSNEAEAPFIDSQQTYTDSLGNSVVIRNSLPRGGQTQTGPDGIEHRYLIFWTQVINRSDADLNLSVGFNASPIALPSAPTTHFYLLLPNEHLTPQKVPLANYGLQSIAATLDDGLGKPSTYKTTLGAHTTAMWYVVTAFNQGVEGVVRAGFTLEGNELFYRVNEKKIACGQLMFE